MTKPESPNQIRMTNDRNDARLEHLTFPTFRGRWVN